ncbi:hypothetical protein EVAR_48668_1 [Eumeta japonica]|uniref:Pre-C2HC domain-containing protein n=1 Tax=Eumeta variegata TaxID=151549 RepID=A0A4C1X9I6_EUMVA|nr:hypothetical protein EVAR_48668_1 [Eumeta japonica]
MERGVGYRNSNSLGKRNARAVTSRLCSKKEGISPFERARFRAAILLSRYCVSGPAAVDRLRARLAVTRVRATAPLTAEGDQNQGYVISAETNKILNDVGSASSASSKEQSPGPSVCSRKRTSRVISSDEGLEQSNTTVKSSDEEKQDEHTFQVIKRKHKKVARQLRKSSNKSRVSNMDIEPCKGKLAEHTYSSASPVPSISQASTADHKQPRIQNPTIRRLNSLLIKNNLPFHIYALKEERKVKAVLKGILLEFNTEDIEADLEKKGYSVLAVHGMHRRDETTLGMILVVLERCDTAKDIFKKLFNVYGLSGVIVEAVQTSNRHFTFRLDNTYSSMRPIRAGVPQGSTLSPLLYTPGTLTVSCDRQPAPNSRFLQTIPRSSWDQIAFGTVFRDYRKPLMS